MPTIREQIDNQRQNFEDALVTGGMPRAAAVVYAKHLTPIVAAAEIAERREAIRLQVLSKKAELRDGTITEQEYNDWYTANRIDEFARLNLDGSVMFG